MNMIEVGGKYIMDENEELSTQEIFEDLSEEELESETEE